MLVYILIAIAVLFVLFLIIVSTRPGEFRYERKALMAAPPAAVFAHVNDFHKWEAWSPWAKLDPTMKTKYEGSSAGAGALYSWEGNNKVGSGKMTITESQPGALVRLKLEFFKPFQATNVGEFTFESEGAQTKVTWSMTGKNNFMAKAFGLVCDFDKMIGKDFEKGLAQMKAIVEAEKKN